MVSKGSGGPVRVLVVGGGVMGRAHARTLNASRLAALCGVVDLDETVAKAVALDLGTNGYTDLRQAIAESRPTAVVIATPDPTHRAAAEIALESRLHLLIEKPLATSVADAEAIVAGAAEQRVRLMTGHLVRFDQRFEQIAAAVRTGATGTPTFLTSSRWVTTPFGLRVAATTTPLWHLLIHDIDLIQWITGAEIDTVDAALQVDSSEGPSAFSATGTLANGAVFQLAGGWTLPSTRGPDARFEIHATQQHVVIRTWEEGMLIAEETGAGMVDEAKDSVDVGVFSTWLKREIDHFLSGIIDGTPYVISGRDAVAAVRAAQLLEGATRRTTT